MARRLYLLDLSVLAELTRPNGNRRVFTLFQQRQNLCAISAPAVCALLRGVESLQEGQRRMQIAGLINELLHSGPPVLPFDRDAALWLARESARRGRMPRIWTHLEGQQSAIAATQEMILVVQNAGQFAGTPGLRIEDWFRP